MVDIRTSNFNPYSKFIIGLVTIQIIFEFSNNTKKLSEKTFFGLKGQVLQSTDRVFCTIDVSLNGIIYLTVHRVVNDIDITVL